MNIGRLLMIGAFTALAGCGEPVAKPTPIHWDDGRSTFSRIGFWTDPETGCEYVIDYRGGIAPRFDSAGKQICLRDHLASAIKEQKP